MQKARHAVRHGHGERNANVNRRHMHVGYTMAFDM